LWNRNFKNVRILRRTIGVLLFTICLGLAFRPVTTAQADRPMITVDNAKNVVALKTFNVDTKTSLGVSRVAISPDNKLLGLAMLDFTARVLEISSGNEILVFRGHKLALNAIHFDNTGNYLVTASNDRKIIMWNVRSGSLENTMGPARGVVNCLAFSPNGQWMASGSGDNLVSLWDAKTGDRAKVFSGPTGSVFSVAFSLDSKVLASAGADGVVRLWDVEAQKAITTLKGPAQEVLALAFSPDHILAAGARGFPRSRIYLWNTQTGESLGMIEGVGGQLATLAFSPDGSLLAVGVGSASVELWDITSKQKVATLSIPGADAGAVVNSMEFSRDGTLLVWAATPNQVNVWGIP